MKNFFNKMQRCFGLAYGPGYDGNCYENSFLGAAFIFYKPEAWYNTSTLAFTRNDNANPSNLSSAIIFSQVDFAPAASIQARYVFNNGFISTPFTLLPGTLQGREFTQSNDAAGWDGMTAYTLQGLIGGAWTDLYTVNFSDGNTAYMPTTRYASQGFYTTGSGFGAISQYYTDRNKTFGSYDAPLGSYTGPGTGSAFIASVTPAYTLNAGSISSIISDHDVPLNQPSPGGTLPPAGDPIWGSNFVNLPTGNFFYGETNFGVVIAGGGDTILNLVTAVKGAPTIGLINYGLV